MLTAPARKAALKVRTHSAVGAKAPISGQHASRRFRGPSCTASQYRRASGSGGSSFKGYTASTTSSGPSSFETGSALEAAEAEAVAPADGAGASPENRPLHERATSVPPAAAQASMRIRLFMRAS
jgi:hypothetical protein